MLFKIWTPCNLNEKGFILTTTHYETCNSCCNSKINSYDNLYISILYIKCELLLLLLTMMYP